MPSATIPYGMKSLRRDLNPRNMDSSGRLYHVNQVGMSYSNLFSNYNAGIRKPDPKCYLDACAMLEKKPDECVSVYAVLLLLFI